MGFISSLSGTGTLRSAARFFLLFAISAAPALAQPTISKVFTPNTIGPGNIASATFTISNGSGAPVTDLAFSDDLPSVPGPLLIADPANAATDCDLGLTGSLSAPAGGSTIALSGAQIGAGQSCTVTVDVTAATAGAHTNPAITLSSSAGSSMSLPVDLTVNTSYPGFTKSFAPSTISLGSKSTLTFTFDNSLNAAAVTFLSFTDNLPTGMVIADPANSSYDCGMPNFELTAEPGSSVISMSDSGIAFPGFEVILAGATCSLAVDVIGTSTGLAHNTTSELNFQSGVFASAGKASDTLNVTVTPLSIQKAFVNDPVAPGDTVTLDFSISNLDRNFGATNVAFVDDLTTLSPALAGLTFSSLLSNDCGGTVGGVGSTTISLSGGNLAPEATCSISTSLSVPAVATPGVYTNTTGTVTGNVGGSASTGNMAVDTLFVEPAPLITKTFLADPVNPGDSVVLEFTVTNTSTTSSATNIAFTDSFSTILPTASVTPATECCGTGSSCAFTPLFNPPPPSDVSPATFSLTGGTLAAAGTAGDSCTFSVTLDVDSGAPSGIYPNLTSTVTATVDGATREGDGAFDELTVLAAPALTKVFVDDPVAPGDLVTLEFVLTHPADAPSDATAISFTDDLSGVLAGLTANLPSSPNPPCGPASSLTGSAGDTLLTLTNGELVPGDTCTFSVTLNVPAGAAPGNYANTTSSVSATVDGFAATSASATDNLNVTGLVFEKAFLDDPVIPGEAVTVRYSISNIHPTDDATSISFSHNLPDILPGVPDITATLPPTVNTCGGSLSGTSFMTYAGGSLLSGQSCDIEVTLQVPAAAANETYASSTGSLTATQGGVVIIDPATATLTVDGNRLQLTKSYVSNPVAPGDNTVLEFELTNLDNNGAASSVSFSDDFDAALSGLTLDTVTLDTCGGSTTGAGTSQLDVTGVSLAAAASCSIHVSLAVPGAAVAGDYPGDTSAVTGTIAGLTVTGDPAGAELNVLQLLPFSQSVDGPTTATGTATLTFNITNPGSEDATEIAFTHDLNAVVPGLIATSLPASPCGLASTMSGISFLTFAGGELDASGGSCSFDVEVLVPASATAGSFNNATSSLFQNGLQVAAPASTNLVIEPPPTFAKVFTPAGIGAGLTSTLTFTVDNAASALAATAASFTDNLPAGMTIATPANATNSCGGTLTAAAASGTVSLTGANVGAGANCQISVDVTAGSTGDLVNVTGDLTSSSGNSGTATDTLVVVSQPGFSKAFSPDLIALGDTSTLVLSIDNSGSSVAADSLSFTDAFPTGLVVATPANAGTTCAGGTLTAVSGSGSISYVGGSAAPNATCSVSVDVTSSSSGAFSNLSGELTSSLGNSGTAEATLVINPQPGFSKAFSPNEIASGATSTVVFTISNSSSTVAATALDFTDNLPAAMVVATPANASTTCTGGVLSANAGGGVIAYTAGTVSATSVCTVSADVTSSTPGVHVNTTGDLTSSLGNSGPASDSLTVNPRPGFSKSFSPDTIGVGGVSTLSFVIDNSGSTIAADNLSFTDPLPVNLLVADAPNASTDCSGGAISADAGSGAISYSGGSAAAGATCTVVVDVTSDVADVYNSVSGDLTSSLGNSGPAGATITVNATPAFDKTFSPNPVVVRDVTTLTYTIDNTANPTDADSLSFVDSLPGALRIAESPNATTSCTGGTLTAAADSASISYSGGSVGTGAICEISVDVSSPVAGTFDSVSGELSSSLGSSGSAAATLRVNGPPVFSMNFNPNPISIGETTVVTFSINNSGSTVDAQDLSFTNVFPTGVVVASIPNAITTCVGGTLTAAADGDTVSYSGGTAPAGSACLVQLEVTSDTIGSYQNTSGTLESNLTSSGSTKATLDVVDRADLAISITNGAEEVGEGALVDYLVIVSNLGSVDGTGATVTVTQPEDLIDVTWECIPVDPGADCSRFGSGDVVDVLDLPPGTAVHFLVTGTVAMMTDAEVILQGSVAVPPGLADSDLSNNSAQDMDPITDLLLFSGFELGEVLNLPFSAGSAKVPAYALKAQGYLPVRVLAAFDKLSSLAVVADVRQGMEFLELRISERDADGVWYVGPWEALDSDFALLVEWDANIAHP